MTHDQPSSPSKRHQKSRYQRPRLNTYGRLRDLTLGGVSGTPEGMIGSKPPLIKP